MVNAKSKRKLLTLVFLYFGLICFFFVTDPYKLPVSLLFVTFVWLFLCLFLTFLYLINHLAKKTLLSSRLKRYEFALMAAALPVLLLLLKSVDQLTIKDGLLLLSVYLLTVFYVSKLNINKDV
ncbi:hypothetical protein A3J32_02240 [Candidatus Saccharibacteria bacterium RIFCSPLOWO2_02_FULL_46_7]|nr:MAG: hypothetical protein A3J32_02240 [Candidatus Saccharibacteria bacterium RIFCSPLOWO2_02_FULL_46_7]